MIVENAIPNKITSILYLLILARQNPRDIAIKVLTKFIPETINPDINDSIVNSSRNFEKANWLRPCMNEITNPRYPLYSKDRNGITSYGIFIFIG